MTNENPNREKIQTLLERERILYKYVVPGACLSCVSQGPNEAAFDALHEEMLPLDEDDVSKSGMQQNGNMVIFFKTRHKVSGKVFLNDFCAQTNGAFEELRDKTGFSFPVMTPDGLYLNEVVTVVRPTE